ncbi:nose resistant to fluoxetine protein 6 [Spodoptera frugiperda]|uniref:Nose resistant to fluoxetine protein 6 n=1 Tax=Spodoptera frugiperda TaxID=7108 RepID=A0A9R0DPV5_SPOFR|nr:nose resistant to fluoxetine protein 6 [Spodoptera frugiperda]
MDTHLKILSLLFLWCHSSSAEVYSLNESEYALMPPVLHLDSYEDCIQDADWLYCKAEFALVSDEPSPRLAMIQKYSAHRPTHYNHTLLRHGICVTQTCKKFYEEKRDLRSALEACLNESLYNKYQLKTIILDGYECSKNDMRMEYDNVDLYVGLFCLAVLVLNLVANFGGIADDDSSFLSCFSISRNWKKLIKPSNVTGDPRFQVLQGIHGFRSMTMYLVIAAHVGVTTLSSPSNTAYVEEMYFYGLNQILLNATVVIQTFLVISSFLLVFIWLIYSEKHEPSWKMVPIQFIVRWVRLTPSYAIVLALTATKFGRMASQPNWNIVGTEIADCRRDWWKHLLYINNYFDDSECMFHTWYLAADTQLYIIGTIAFLICRNIRVRRLVLGLLFTVGVITPMLHTYFQGLDGVLVNSPEFVVSWFKTDATFHHVYKRGHTNLASYIIGMAMGYLTYDLTKNKVDPKSLKKYRYLIWAVFPLGLACCYSGTIFYDSPSPPVYVHLLYAGFMKPLFGFFVGCILVSSVLRLENVYRCVIEWSFWRIPSRLSYGVYLLHLLFVRKYAVTLTATRVVSAWTLIYDVNFVAACTMVAATIFWLLVEAPASNLRQYFFKNDLVKENKKAK